MGQHRACRWYGIADRGDSGPVDRIRGTIREKDSPGSIENEIAAELQDILARVRFLHHIAARQGTQIFPDHTGAEEGEPAGPLESEGPVRGSVRIAHDLDVPILLREITAELIRSRLRDDQNSTTRRRERVAGRIHLAEVGIARDSREVPQKHEQQELAIEKRRQPDGQSVRLQEREVETRQCRIHSFTLSSRSKSDADLRSSSNWCVALRGTGSISRKRSPPITA